jgi:hypothetical protein
MPRRTKSHLTSKLKLDRLRPTKSINWNGLREMRILVAKAVTNS